MAAAIVIDPGDIHLEWFQSQFRSAHSWARREEFGSRSRYQFPAFVVVASDFERRDHLIDMWRECIRPENYPLSLSITTRAMLSEPPHERDWRDHWGLKSRLFENTRYTFEPIPPPVDGIWPAIDLPTEGENRCLKPHKSRSRSVMAWMKAGKSQVARALRDHLAVTEHGRSLLSLIGQVPLLSATELAEAMRKTPAHVYATLAELEERELVEKVLLKCKFGYVPTTRAVSLLAGQGGFSLERYTQLRGWALKRAGRDWQYSINALLKIPDHTMQVLEFYLGMIRAPDRDSSVRLRKWEMVGCLHRYKLPKSIWDQEETGRAVYVTPDGIGVTESLSADGAWYLGTRIWVEIDRGTIRGRALWIKLWQYIDAIQRMRRLEKRPPRCCLSWHATPSNSQSGGFRPSQDVC